MAAQSPGSSPSQTPKPPTGSSMKRWVFRIAILLVLAVVAALGWREYRKFRHDRMVDRARELIEKKDYNQAILSAKRALQMNPNDAVAVRMMVELSEAQKTKEALYWHRRLSEMEPASANYIAWADCALRYDERLIADQALARVDKAGQQTAAFQDAAGRLSAMGQQFADADAHFATAVKLEPQNVQYRIRQATIRVRLGTAEQQEEAREVLEKNAADPVQRDTATRALLDYYFRQRAWEKALKLAKQVQETPDATFGDRMLYLGLLRTFNRPEFHSYLLTLQDMAATNPEDASTLITWMGDNTLVMVAVAWARTLPISVAETMPVPPAIGSCYAILHDWDSLLALITDKNWQYTEFLRLAFLARVQREQGDLLNSRNSWISAVKATANRPHEILMLTNYATKWGWDSEVHDMLWVTVRGTSGQGQEAAISALHQNYTETGNTRGLLNLATRMYEINPRDPIAINNVVMLSLLLNTNVERAQSLADEVHQLQPTNPGVISTYAYALYIRGKTEDAIKLMRTLDPNVLNSPNVAAYFAAMLVEGEAPDEATKYIEIAKTGKLLPEEMEMVKNARETLIRRKAETAKSPQAQ